MVTLRPSTKPVSLNPLWNAATAFGWGAPVKRNPMNGNAACCALAASGHATAAPPRVMNWRRFIDGLIRLHRQ